MNYRHVHSTERNANMATNYAVIHTNVDHTTRQTRVCVPNVEMAMRLAYTDGNAAVVNAFSSNAYERGDKYRNYYLDPQMYLHEY
ncbi:unnamed protein product [Heterobilharzia americana]|nr:unnamed protein product [Heterobilharzia americana]CAH8615095.1 unnamed protein product [Heterobilharzia americana]